MLQVTSPSDISNAKKLLFPGVGSYGQAMGVIKARGYTEPLKEYLAVGRYHALYVCARAYAAQNAGQHILPTV